MRWRTAAAPSERKQCQLQESQAATLTEADSESSRVPPCHSAQLSVLRTILPERQIREPGSALQLRLCVAGGHGGVGAAPPAHPPG